MHMSSIHNEAVENSTIPAIFWRVTTARTKLTRVNEYVVHTNACTVCEIGLSTEDGEIRVLAILHIISLQ